MRRRQAVQFLGAALALPFLPRSARAAIELAEHIHSRLGDVPFRTLNPDQQKLVTTITGGLFLLHCSRPDLLLDRSWFYK